MTPSNARRPRILAATAAALLAMTALAGCSGGEPDAADDTIAALQAQVEALDTRVTELEAAQLEDGAVDPQVEIDALSADVAALDTDLATAQAEAKSVARAVRDQVAAAEKAVAKAKKAVARAQESLAAVAENRQAVVAKAQKRLAQARTSLEELTAAIAAELADRASTQPTPEASPSS